MAYSLASHDLNIYHIETFIIIFRYHMKCLLIISNFFEKGKAIVNNWYQNLDDNLIRECVESVLQSLDSRFTYQRS